MVPHPTLDSSVVFTKIIRDRIIPMLPMNDFDEHVGGAPQEKIVIYLKQAHLDFQKGLEPDVKSNIQSCKEVSMEDRFDSVIGVKRKFSEALPECDCDAGGDCDHLQVRLSTAASPTSVDSVDNVGDLVDSEAPFYGPLPLEPSVSGSNNDVAPLLHCLPLLNHHIDLLIRESEQQKYLRPLLQKLLTHIKNKNIFNFPVRIPGYEQVIQNPNDLGTVKERLLGLKYRDWGAFRREVRLVFSNAMLYNHPSHHVHKKAVIILNYFEEEFEKVLQKHCKDLEARDAVGQCKGGCQCNGEPCRMCNEKCLQLDPPVLACAGTCGLKVKRGGVYFVTEAGDRLWCQRCYTGMPATLPAPEDDSEVGSHCTLKKDLLKRCYNDVIFEPWVECTRCSVKVHQICAIAPSLDDFVCSWCLSDVPAPPVEVGVEEVRRLALSECPVDGGDVVDGVSPGVPGGLEGVDFDNPHTAARLPETRSSRFIQDMVRRKLVELEVGDAATSVTVRVLSNARFHHAVPPTVLQYFGRREKGSKTYSIEYQSKAIYLFQQLDGVDVCFFCMYVQEYGDDAPECNRNRAYVAYLDSVDMFRPRQCRTAVYHEALLAYFVELRMRNFRAVHLWSCPPTRGNNFIFWCHPNHQRSPGPDRLREWYVTMADEAEARGIVLKKHDMYELYFAGNRAHERLPPIFDGDFWVAEADRVSKRRGFLNSSGKPLPLERHCEYILLSLLSLKGAEWFTSPVDPVKLNIPHYTSVVTQPMDLGTVRDKLNRSVYRNPQELAADVNLTFDNAILFNPSVNPVHKAALMLKAQFNQDFENMLQHMDANEVMNLNGVMCTTPAPSSESGGDDSRVSPLVESVSTSVQKHKDNLFVLEFQHRCGVCDEYVGVHATAWRCGVEECSLGIVCGQCCEESPESVVVKHGASHELVEFTYDMPSVPPSLGEESLDLDLFEKDVSIEAGISHPMIDSRHMFLEWCQTRHYQFDSLRRAKFSTAMMLRHLHTPDGGKSLELSCGLCGGSMFPTRWNCSTCQDFNLCGDCVITGRPDGDVHTCTYLEQKSTQEHLLTPFRVVAL